MNLLIERIVGLESAFIDFRTLCEKKNTNMEVN
jgi:hypothetical protein